MFIIKLFYTRVFHEYVSSGYQKPFYYNVVENPKELHQNFESQWTMKVDIFLIPKRYVGI